jgi:hypothetical protein
MHSRVALILIFTKTGVSEVKFEVSVEEGDGSKLPRSTLVVKEHSHCKRNPNDYRSQRCRRVACNYQSTMRYFAG